MRLLVLALLPIMSLAAIAGDGNPPKSYPLWDGEPIEEYAKNVGLPTTKTIDLGDGVTMEFVLIPAGKFTMGRSAPTSVDEWAFRTRILAGQVALVVGSGTLLVLLSVTVAQAIRRRQRPQFSLARLLVMAGVAGMGLLGGLHWWYSERAFNEANVAYAAALARYQARSSVLPPIIMDDRPGHEVTLTRPFYIGKHEVTQEQYHEAMGTNPSRVKGRALPVDRVCWDDTQEFCKKVSKRTGLIFRLPTEAEWEHACRAGTKTAYSAGDAETDLDRVGWYHKNSNCDVHPVGQKAPNNWGIYDMHGNALEWCQDNFGKYMATAETDPTGPETDPRHLGVWPHVLRSGCAFVDWKACRSANRFVILSNWWNLPIGFRVVLSLPRKP